MWKGGLALALWLALVGSALAGDIAIDPAIAANKQSLKVVQRNLNDAGFRVGKPDGVFGARSKNAFSDFLAQYGPTLPKRLDEASATRLAHVAHMRSASPWDVKPANFHPFILAMKFGFDLRQATDVSCPASKCTANPEMLAIGDLTGDGIPEIVYDTDFNTHDGRHVNLPAPLKIFTRDKNGRYSVLPVKTDQKGGVARVDSRQAIIADFNGDGVGDLFVATTGLDQQPFPGEQNVLLLSSPNGLVDRSRTNLPVQNDFAHGVAAGDLDGDGDHRAQRGCDRHGRHFGGGVRGGLRGGACRDRAAAADLCRRTAARCGHRPHGDRRR